MLQFPIFEMNRKEESARSITTGQLYRGRYIYWGSDRPVVEQLSVGYVSFSFVWNRGRV